MRCWDLVREITCWSQLNVLQAQWSYTWEVKLLPVLTCIVAVNYLPYYTYKPKYIKSFKWQQIFLSTEIFWRFLTSEPLIFGLSLYLILDIKKKTTNYEKCTIEIERLIQRPYKEAVQVLCWVGGAISIVRLNESIFMDRHSIDY